MARSAFELEYIIRSSPTILYNFLSTPSGLAQWFSDTCDINGSEYSFGWNGNIEKATLIESVENEMIRFQWDSMEDDEYFEFLIERNEVSNDTILVVTDFAEEDDIEDQILLWDSQIKRLRQQSGS
ncbi:MAG: hypothetical protein HKN92_05870 [Chitinophagales bacterium]|nr:hypothetical protein [Chitinophagales bacterium]